MIWTCNRCGRDFDVDKEEIVTATGETIMGGNCPECGDCLCPKCAEGWYTEDGICAKCANDPEIAKLYGLCG